MQPKRRLRSRQRLGKYRLEKRLGQGGFAEVFQAYDSIEGIRVALKVPQHALLNADLLEDFRKEVRLAARFDHPNILPIKNADFVDGHFVVVYPLGDESLADRLRRRMSFPLALEFAEQVVGALAHAHSHRVVHCDVKPDNFIRFDDQLKLSDFGISKIAYRTMQASGSGTLGFMAPEQAMGRPSLRSDVFAAGLLLYRLFAGVVPEWPFEWPPPGFERARRKVHPDLLAVLERSLKLDPRARYADAQALYEAFVAVRAKAQRFGQSAKKRPAKSPRSDWRAVQLRQFRRRYGQKLEADLACKRCERPVSEAMLACPWCGVARKKLRDETRFPASCTRCRRGMKLDWKYCPWCYGGSVGPRSERSYSDKRYTARCHKSGCRGQLMPFMRYCPWCRAKVRRAWTLPSAGEKCGGCGWVVLDEYWSTCPWCTKALRPDSKRHAARRRSR